MAGKIGKGDAVVRRPRYHRGLPKTEENVLMLKAIETKMSELVAIATSYVGVHEVGGNNHGPQVEIFQRSVDGKANGESWCMAFAQFCIRSVDSQFEGPNTWLFATEHCMTAWNRTTMEARIQTLDVMPGDLVLWQHFDGGKPTSNGHVGVVAKMLGLGKFETIEGNTSDGSGVNRDGDGVYRRVRSVDGSGTMRLKGFIRPWGISPSP